MYVEIFVFKFYNFFCGQRRENEKDKRKKKEGMGRFPLVTIPFGNFQKIRAGNFYGNFHGNFRGMLQTLQLDPDETLM